jgi:hypothetical protein
MDKVYTRYCKRCGLLFDTDSPRAKLCPDCADYKKTKAQKTKDKPNPLDAMLKEIAEYNRKNGTSLSYGQYVSKFGK